MYMYVMYHMIQRSLTVTFSLTPKHTHTHIHTYIYTYIHIYIHIYSQFVERLDGTMMDSYYYRTHTVV